jgi:hypothetical protein
VAGPRTPRLVSVVRYGIVGLIAAAYAGQRLCRSTVVSAKASCMPNQISFTIRAAKSTDAATVSALLRESYSRLIEKVYEAAVRALPLITKARSELLGSKTYVLAETADGLRIGAGDWAPEPPLAGEHPPDRAHIRHFATHP